MAYIKMVPFLGCLSLSLHIWGQSGDAADNSLSLIKALSLAEKNYPFLKSKLYEAEAAGKNIALSKNTLVPSLDISYQANLATGNNITGMFYPGEIIPMTGPVFASNNYNPGFGTATSLLLDWQPYTFGKRQAEINRSKAELATRKADAENEIFKHQLNVASAYLDVLLETELVKVDSENLERTNFNLKQSRILAITGLRPGVDTALFLSELSVARIQLLNTRKNLHSRLISLSELLATDSSFTLTDTIFSSRIPAPDLKKQIPSAQHPLLKFSKSELDLSRSKENVLKKSWIPKLDIWGTGFARGSGIYPDGTIKAGDGWGFSKYNYGLGFQVAFPILKFSEMRLQQQQQSLISKSNAELVHQTTLQLSKQQAISEVNMQTALEVAKETPVLLKSAEYAFRSLQKRYNAGLVNFADLIQAQYNLVKAETDLRKSYWEAWKALLYKAAVTGDLNLFLNESR
ncbi:MAG TPA: TolC family protein [Puia sp.]